MIRTTKPSKYLAFFAAQVAAACWAILCFRSFEPRQLAAILAGSGFWVLGFTILWVQRRQRGAVFWSAFLLTFIFSLPMLLTRVWYWGHENFSQVSVLGVPSQVFHRGSEWMYMAMVLATLVGLVRAYMGQRKVP